MKDNQKPTDFPSPYQDAESKVETTDVFYFSPANKESVYLGKTIKRTDIKGEVSFELIDPTESIFGPPISDEDSVRNIWATIATALEQRAEELKEQREKGNSGKDKENER